MSLLKRLELLLQLTEILHCLCEDVGSIPDLPQWVKDLELLLLQTVAEATVAVLI